MYQQVERLSILLDFLSDSLCKSKKTASVEQVLKAEDIILGDNAQLNIQQNQYVIVHQADKWVGEAKQIVNDLLKYIPNESNSLLDAVRHLKFNAVEKALKAENGKKLAAAKRLGIERRTLNYIYKEMKQ